MPRRDRRAVPWLGSSGSGFVTGQAIAVDGDFTVY